MASAILDPGLPFQAKSTATAIWPVLISCSAEDRRPNWPPRTLCSSEWLITYQDSNSCKWSPISVLTGSALSNFVDVDPVV